MTPLGTIVATWHEMPHVERIIALPSVIQIQTLKMMGNYRMLFQEYRMKIDFVNGAVSGFVSGAPILGYSGELYVHF